MTTLSVSSLHRRACFSAFWLPHCCAGAAVDDEHQLYAQVETSLEFLQERLEAAERAGAGEEERYQHTTAELHEQLEQQASELVECQHRIANLKEELEASKQRLEDEQHNEALLAKRAQELEREAAAAGRQLEQIGVDASRFPAVEVAVPGAAVVGGDGAVASSATLPEVQAEAVSAKAAAAQPSATRSGRWAALLESVEEQQVPEPVMSSSGSSSNSARSEVPRLNLGQQAGKAEQEPAAAAAAAGSAYDSVDMSAVRKHVEDMAAQYVEKLSMAEAELQVVRSVWQQAEDDLAAMRSSPRNSNDGSRTSSPRATSPRASATGAAEGTTSSEAPGSPRLLTASGRVGPGDFELVRIPPVNAPMVVSGSSHVGAEADHDMGERIAFVLELPSPQFGGGHVGKYPRGYKSPAADSGISSSSSSSYSQPLGATEGSSAGQATSRFQGRKPVVAAAAVSTSVSVLSPTGLAGMHGASPAPGQSEVLPRPDHGQQHGSRDAGDYSLSGAGAAAGAASDEAERSAALQLAAEQGVQSSIGSARVRVRMVAEASAAGTSDTS